MGFEIKKFEQLSLLELYEIIKLRQEVFIVEQNCPYHDCDGNDTDAWHVFYKENGHVAACLRILKKGVTFDETAIGRFVVRKNLRKRGVGRRMMEISIDFIENQLKTPPIKMQAQSYLLDFYKSFGFTEISGEYIEDGIPHYDLLRK